MQRLFFLFLLFLVFGCSTPQLPSPGAVSDITFSTNDYQTIKGTLYENANGKGVLLLHMLGQDRYSWDPLASELHEKGYTVLAIDFRGHGASEGDWESFTEEDFVNMVLDVQEARHYLNTTEVAIIGASIGANVGALYASMDKDVKTMVLLSPGRNYHGIDIENAVAAFGKRILFIATEEDIYSSKTALTLSTKDAAYQVEIYPGELHGTDMFTHSTVDVKKRVHAWLDMYYPVFPNN